MHIHTKNIHLKIMFTIKIQNVKYCNQKAYNPDVPCEAGWIPDFLIHIQKFNVLKYQVINKYSCPQSCSLKNTL